MTFRAHLLSTACCLAKSMHLAAGKGRTWVLLSLLATYVGGIEARAEITPRGPLKVRILLDNSGSMYPGYKPGNVVKKTGLGVLFVREYPEFAQWLSDFVARQSVLHGEQVSLYSVTSGTTFHSNDVQLSWPPSPLARFEAREALGRISGWGKLTFLTESLTEVSRGFEGLVWLITDNIVETGEGTPDSDVIRFFKALRDTPQYRSVHLFKLPIRDRQRGKTANLAVYGVIVSSTPPDRGVLTEYDGLFRKTFRIATRHVSGATVPLFEGQEHLKLKNLSVDTFELRFKPDLVVRVDERSPFLERRDLHIQLRGDVISNLTHHTVVAGSYKLSVIGSFQPDEVAKREFGVEEIPNSQFGPPKSRVLVRPIPPSGVLPFDEDISSLKPVSLRNNSPTAWLKSALYGVRARYRGRVKMSFGRVKVRLERERLIGVFGSDRAPEVFGIKDNDVLDAESVPANISFTMETSGIRSLALLALLLPLLIFLAFLVRLFTSQEHYRVQVGEIEKTIGLRRLGTFPVDHGSQRLGLLKRPLTDEFVFRPVVDIPGIEVKPEGTEGRFIARLGDQATVMILIQPLKGLQGRPPSTGPSTGIRRPGDLPGSTDSPAGGRERESRSARPEPPRKPPVFGRPT